MIRNDKGRPQIGTFDGFLPDYDTRRKQVNLSKTAISSGNVDDTDNTPSTISWSSTNITATLTMQGDGSAIPGFTVTIPTSSLTIKGAYYNVEVKLSTNGWNTNASYSIYQPTSGDPVLTITPVIGSVTYNFRVRGVSSMGTVGVWSNEISKASVGDTSNPNTPIGLTATALIKSVQLEWIANTESDLRHYNIYRGLTSTPRELIASINSTTYIDSDVTSGTKYYYCIKAVDYSGNSSGYSSVVNATPANTMASDLAKTMQPFTSNIDFYPTTYYETSRVSWNAGTIAFADGGFQSINPGTTTALTAGTVYYLYFTLGSATLTLTTTYSLCVSDTKALICIVSVDDGATSMGIFPVNSKLPLVNADVIAANSIMTIHLQADSVDASKVANVGSSATSGSRLKMTHSDFRIYHPSSTSDENYYPIEINTSGLRTYNCTGPTSPTSPECYIGTDGKIMAGAGNVELSSGGIKVKASKVLSFYNGTTPIGYIYSASTGFGLFAEAGKIINIKDNSTSSTPGAGGVLIESTKNTAQLKAGQQVNLDAVDNINITSSGQDVFVKASAAGKAVRLEASSVIMNTAALLPYTSGNNDLGSSSYCWRNLYGTPILKASYAGSLVEGMLLAPLNGANTLQIYSNGAWRNNT